MFGKIQLEEFKGITTMPQNAASAFSAIEGLVGATYKPLLYLGKQIVKGTNYYFVAEQTIVTSPLIRRVVKLAINEFDGKYELVPESVEDIV